MKRFVWSAAIALAAHGSLAAELGGPATVVDGDTLEVAGNRLRLVGIDAPELGQICRFGAADIDCGAIARSQLNDLTAGVSVSCDVVERRADGINVARCEADGYDLSRGMVYTGWARADGEGRYLADERESRDAGRGLWSGEFPSPLGWRVRNGRPAADG